MSTYVIQKKTKCEHRNATIENVNVRSSFLVPCMKCGYSMLDDGYIYEEVDLLDVLHELHLYPGKNDAEITQSKEFEFFITIFEAVFQAFRGRE